MNRKFNKPIVRAAIIVLICLFFISFGLATGESSFWGNLKMIVSAFFSTITFIVGITVAILLSLVILIGLFLGGTAIYSRPKAKEMAKKLWASATAFGEIAKEFFLKKKDELEHSEKLQERKEHLTKQVKDISRKLGELSDKVKTSNIVTRDSEHKARHAKDPEVKADATPELEKKIEGLSKELGALKEEFAALKESVNQQLAGYQTPTNAPADDLPPPMHILRYIEGDEQRARFTEYVNETVRQRLSFAKARAYLEKELPEDLRTHIEEHPRLTKDFIRHQRHQLGWS